MDKHRTEERLRQLQVEIDWIKNQMATKKLSQKNIKTYNHQIKEREYEIIGLLNPQSA